MTYADKLVGDILAQLKETGQHENTIVVLWGDHGWHLGEHAIWGKHSLFEESLHSPLIISAPGMQELGKKTDAVVETVDIFPTLCELARLPGPEFSDGVSLMPQLADPNVSGHIAYSYHGRAKTIRTATHRLTLHSKGYVELYDHLTSEKESKNLADQNPELCENLTKLLLEKAAR